MQQFDFAFLHGGGQGSWVWNETIAALQMQSGDTPRKILALDIPGCGTKRGRVLDNVAPNDVVCELIVDLERAEMRNIVLVGHSLAGNVLPAMAELRPDLFRRLIYVACSIPLPGQTPMQMMGRGLHGSASDQVGWPVDPAITSLRDRYEIMFCNDMDEKQRAAFLGCLENDEWPRSFFSATNFVFNNIEMVPATYVLCLQDRSLPVVWQETFAARLQANRVVRIDAGHQAMITRPHVLAKMLLKEATSV